MASNTSSLAFYLPVAELTDLALDGPAGSSTLPSTRRLSLQKAHLDGLRSVDDLIICLDNLGVSGPLTVHAPALKLLGEGGQFNVHEGSLLDPATDCEWGTIVGHSGDQDAKVWSASRWAIGSCIFYGSAPDQRLLLGSRSTEASSIEQPSEHRQFVRMGSRRNTVPSPTACVRDCSEHNGCNFRPPHNDMAD